MFLPTLSYVSHHQYSWGVKKLDPKLVEAVMLKAGLVPLEPYPGSGKKWKSRHVNCGEIVFPRYDKIVAGQSGCKSCGIIRGTNKRKVDLESAIALMLNAGMNPLVPYENANIPWKSQCLKCEKVSTPALASVKKGTGCRFCSGNAKLDETEARKVMLAAGLEPLEPYVLSSTPWKSKCKKCKKIVSPTYSAIQQGATCVYCSGLKIDEDEAVKVMLASGLQPLEPYKRSNSPWKCLCLKCKKIVTPAYSGIQQNKNRGGCEYCSGKKVDPDDAIKVMIDANLKPLKPYKSHDTKWECTCLKCGKTVFPRYDSIKTGQGGCRYCAEKGINMKTPSYLYLITNFELGAHKVGMGNHKKLNDRLSKFVKNGWKTHKVWNTDTGAEAIDIEAEVFRILRKEMNLPSFLSRLDMPKTEGHTETINADSITLLELEKIINKVIKGHRKNP